MLRVSKDGAAPPFETHCFAMLLRMRPLGTADHSVGGASSFRSSIQAW